MIWGPSAPKGHLPVGDSFKFDASLLSTAQQVLQKEIANRGSFHGPDRTRETQPNLKRCLELKEDDFKEEVHTDSSYCETIVACWSLFVVCCCVIVICCLLRCICYLFFVVRQCSFAIHRGNVFIDILFSFFFGLVNGTRHMTRQFHRHLLTLGSVSVDWSAQNQNDIQRR